MESKKVISKKNLPTRSPILATVVYVLAMDYWNAPQWLWGAVGLLLVFIWIAWIVSFFNQDEIDIMSKWNDNSDNGTTPKSKSKFQEKLEEAMKGNK